MVDTDDTRRTIDDGRRTTPGVWHKLPTGELKIKSDAQNWQLVGLPLLVTSSCSRLCKCTMITVYYKLLLCIMPFNFDMYQDCDIIHWGQNITRSSSPTVKVIVQIRF